MKVELKRVDEAFHLVASGSTDTMVDIDASEAAGGHSRGARPMELVLMGLGGCSGIDVISILKKQKQEIKSFAIAIEAERVKDKIPAVFKTIHVTFKLTGRLDEKKVKKAVELSMKKYCSVTAMLEKTAEISYSYEIDG